MSEQKKYFGVSQGCLVSLLLGIGIFVFISISLQNYGRTTLRGAFIEIMKAVLKTTGDDLNKYREEHSEKSYPSSLSDLSGRELLKRSIDDKKLADWITGSEWKYSIRYNMVYEMIDKDHFLLSVHSNNPKWGSMRMPALMMKEDMVIKVEFNR